MKKSPLILMWFVILYVGCSGISESNYVGRIACNGALNSTSVYTGRSTGTFVIHTNPSPNEKLEDLARDACICAYIAARPEPFDDLTARQVTQGLSLWVNDSLVSAKTFRDPDSNYRILEREDWPKGATANAPENFPVCWMHSYETDGKQAAKIDYQLTSGEVRSYSWEFELVE